MGWVNSAMGWRNFGILAGLLLAWNGATHAAILCVDETLGTPTPRPGECYKLPSQALAGGKDWLPGNLQPRALQKKVAGR